jgi:ABC-2 type transport system ATP-binding protein
MNTMGPEPAIQVDGVTRQFFRKRALNNVSLTVPKGCVFGLLGENGAGKTTLIRHILGAFTAKSGQVRVLGKDPVANPVDVLGNVGYLSEEREMPTWMRIAELLRFTESFYPKWDRTYAAELMESFRLDPQAKVRTLSRGERAKTGLILALAHRPDILVLDEPSSGLDVIVRQDILAAIVRTVADEGRTVFFSSHLIDEVERVSDHIAIMANGKVLVSDTLENIKEDHSRLTIQYKSPLSAAPSIDGAFSCQGQGREWTVICNGQREKVLAHVLESEAEVVNESQPTLEEIFVARAKAVTN